MNTVGRGALTPPFGKFICNIYLVGEVIGLPRGG